MDTNKYNDYQNEFFINLLENENQNYKDNTSIYMFNNNEINWNEMINKNNLENIDFNLFQFFNNKYINYKFNQILISYLESKLDNNEHLIIYYSKIIINFCLYKIKNH